MRKPRLLILTLTIISLVCSLTYAGDPPTAETQPLVTENENPGIDYFGYAVKGLICVAILAFWILLAVYPLCRFFGLNFFSLPLQLEFFPFTSFQGLLIYPLVYFIYPPFYALVITLLYEVAVVLLQILLKISQYLSKLLAKH